MRASAIKRGGGGRGGRGGGGTAQVLTICCILKAAVPLKRPEAPGLRMELRILILSIIAVVRRPRARKAALGGLLTLSIRRMPPWAAFPLSGCWTKKTIFCLGTRFFLFESTLERVGRQWWGQGSAHRPSWRTPITPSDSAASELSPHVIVATRASVRTTRPPSHPGR